jgi:hypothetical protein
VEQRASVVQRCARRREAWRGGVRDGDHDTFQASRGGTPASTSDAITTISFSTRIVFH